MPSRPRQLAVIAIVTVLALLSACGSGDDSSAGASGERVTLSLVGFAVPKAANNAIQKRWAETDEGKGVSWQESYGASGDQSRAVVAGLAADYVHFSVEGDVTRLVREGLVAEDWNTGPTGGIVSQSVVVLAVRPGNPKKITGWDDLVKPGVGVVTPNPGSSGSAKWNIMAAYGHALAKGGSEADAEAFVTDLFENIVALPGSGRDATTAFLSGTGDVLLSYENEAILARQNGEKLDYIVPDTTLLIENPGAITLDAHPKAAAWIEYVRTAEAQGEFARLGFRPVIDDIDLPEVKGANDPDDPFPAPKRLVTIGEDFGGWQAVDKKFFDTSTGLITAIQAKTGKAS